MVYQYYITPGQSSLGYNHYIYNDYFNSTIFRFEIFMKINDISQQLYECEHHRKHQTFTKSELKVTKNRTPYRLTTTILCANIRFLIIPI